VNDKETARRIIAFDAPDRVLVAPPSHSVAFYGANHEGFPTGPGDDGGGHHLPVGSQWVDIWGVRWHREHEGVMGFPRGHPLAHLREDLERYRWPDPEDPRICSRIYEQAKGWCREETFLVGSHRDTLWEKSYMLVGMETMMISFHSDPGAVHDLLHRIMDFHLGIARHYVAVGVEMVGMSDDLGTQRGLLLSPKIVETFLVPEYARLFAFYKAHDVLINFHSCGHIMPLLDTFKSLGVDILNPIQATANDLDEVRRRTAADQAGICLQGGVSSATIVEGPVAAIRAEVAQRLWQLGRDGGYFCGPDQGMPWPAAHIQALHDGVAELGHYPLKEGLR
jgi:uroporphyrinogen decarboxylase